MNEVTRFNFIGRISRMGDNRVIWIKEKDHDKIESMVGKDVRIQIDDEMFGSNNHRQHDSAVEDKFIAKVSKEVGENLTKANKPRFKRNT